MLNHVQLCVIPLTVACQDTLSMEVLQVRILSGLSFPSPGELPLSGDWTHVSCVSCIGRRILYYSVEFSSVQSLNHVRLFVNLWTAACQAFLSITNSQSLLKFMSIESVMPSSHFIFCHPLLLQPSIFLSIRVFSNESALCIRWPKYLTFSFCISPSNEHPGLISFKMD